MSKQTVTHAKCPEYGSVNLVRDIEMGESVCSDCGQECEVPFKLDPSRPITGEKPRDIPPAKQSITMMMRASEFTRTLFNTNVQLWAFDFPNDQTL